MMSRRLPLRFVTANMTGHALWQTFANHEDDPDKTDGEMPEPVSTCIRCQCISCQVFSSSWCQGLAATSACGSSWTFLFTFFAFPFVPKLCKLFSIESYRIEYFEHCCHRMQILNLFCFYPSVALYSSVHHF